jgi:tripartite-type tricarboxylate transporter receptor subunit TctC
MSRFKLNAIAIVLLGLCAPGWAQSWPTKPIRAIVPYSAGSASDIIPRTVFAQVEKQLGQPIIIENRVGGGSTIGTAAVAKADPDGYTILATSSAFTTVPATVLNLPYDAKGDFTPVIPLANMTNVLAVSPDKGFKTLADFVAYARKNTGALNYVTIGKGSAAHLNSERFRLSAKFDAQPIPYKGSPEGLTDVMTGRVDFYFCPLLPALPLIRDNKITALAVSSTQRDPKLPNVPTTVEAGFPDSEYNFWFGVFAPAKTPRDIVQKLHDEIAKALQDPAVKDKLAKLGVQAMPLNQAQFNDYVHKEIEQHAALVKAAGIKPE